jgi:hypothetical protein
MRVSVIPIVAIIAAGVAVAAPLLSHRGPSHNAAPQQVLPPPGRIDVVRPGNIVEFRDSGASIPGGGLVVYSVPIDRWLVIRDCEFATGFASVQLVERVGFTDTIKRSDFALTAWHSSLGMTFQPGSDVVITSSGGSGVSYQLDGYLARP